MPTSQRQYLGKEHAVLPELDLIALQQSSYQAFLDHGIQEALDQVNAGKGIEDYTGKNWLLKFGEHRLGEPKNTPSLAKEKNLTYDVPLYVEATLINKRTGERRTQDVFMGDLPKMTPVGTFIINGIERGIVTQLVRAPGVSFSGEEHQATGEVYYSAELRPLRGSWIEFTVNKRNVITVKIDRRRKMSATVLLRAMGIESDEEILDLYRDLIDQDEYNLLQNTLEKDDSHTKDEALIEIYEKLRPGEPATVETAREYFKTHFFDERRYNLGKVGRYKLNRRLKVGVDSSHTVLAKEDIVATLRYLIELQNGKGKVDDIDHLSNRRVRCVGELVKDTAFRIGLIRLERSIREKMSLTKTDSSLTPSALVNARPLIATVSQFFRRNRLSAILDQTNPLAEIDNLRRLSVLGSGGVTRERASFSMRDINASQYSRICPVRSPEGQNIGLVTYLALYTHVNEYGFLEAPYLRVTKEKGKMKVTDEIVYMAADEEEDYKITHAEVEVDKNGYIKKDWIPFRFQNQFMEGPVDEVEFIDVVSRQVVGTSASLIPFIANDEANRALMGSHMQCQAVPLVKAEAPVVGTGMEEAVASSMNRTVYAQHGGEVEYVDGKKIVIKVNKSELKDAQKQDELSEIENISFEDDKEIYQIEKFIRTSQSTSYSQKPLVEIGDKVKKGDLIIDGPAADHGELALGTNLMIAYASYDGLGYEDAIVVSDRLVKEDLLTSIHISEHEARVMDTRLGPEELTNDIPNVSETYLSNLTEDGIVRVGSEVESGDILVGKVAPKGETELSSEERLLRAIFGEKSKEVRDTSLRMPHGEKGTVIDVQVLDRDEGDELDPGVLKQVSVQVAEKRKIKVGDKLAGRHGNKGVISKIVPVADMPHLEDGTPVDIIISPLSVLARMNLGQLLEAHLGWAAQKLGYKVSLPVFESFDESIIWDELEKAGLPRSGKAQLYDGRTGEAYREETAVGVAYILKLVHMVDDKVHARSTGPYSLVTQQPLGGKAQMGGQRLGEMEVWALESHKAAYSLQEMLTIKSDDISGRSKAFKAMVKGLPIPAPTIPESFKVLMRELNSLSLNVIPLDLKEEIVEEEETNQIEEDEDLSLDDLSDESGIEEVDEEDVENIEDEPSEDELLETSSDDEEDDVEIADEE
ncbi:MAG: DNA-directed RNA polymerase subunit beta [Microgenomates bacterium 39_7]|nr:MAG: DNA-directed RNA polymerase subunit beta [Microgenomates bacterium 39_7]